MGRDEYLVFKTNEAGDQASTCFLRIQGGDAQNAIRLAQQRGLTRFNVILRSDSPEGLADNMVAKVAPLPAGAFAAYDNPCPRRGW